MSSILPRGKSETGILNLELTSGVYRMNLILPYKLIEEHSLGSEVGLLYMSEYSVGKIGI